MPSSRLTPDQFKEIAAKQKKRSKYGSRKVTIDGFEFDSKKEGLHYLALREQQRAKEIFFMEIHPSYPLAVNGQLVCKYEGDFSYEDGLGRQIVEDVKSEQTRKLRDYRIKVKLFKALYPEVIFREIT